MLERTAAIAVVVMVLNVGLNLALIPVLGAVGAAIASLISYSTMAALAIGFDRRAGGFAARSLVPGRADIASLARSWTRSSG
jgi:peptidoglycan biosynthesis protein MviN/MurJ (putative lipid II flippase)